MNNQLQITLVTGASGFLGAHICRRLSAAGHTVHATGRREVQPKYVASYRQVDLLAHKEHKLLFDGVDTLVHCAALAHQHDGALKSVHHQLNVLATKRLMQAAAKAHVRRVVFISSSSVYGPGRTGARESDYLAPDTPYAQSKVEGERIATTICRDADIDLYILRPATLYGIGDPGNIGRLIGAILSRRFVWIGRGENRKSLAAVEDVAAAVLRVVAAPLETPEARIYNLAAPSLRMREIVEAIAGAGNLPSGRLTVPAGLAQGLLKAASTASLGVGPAQRVQKSVEKWLSDDSIDAARFEGRFSDFEWQDFRTGIAREVAWKRQLLATWSSRAA